MKFTLLLPGPAGTCDADELASLGTKIECAIARALEESNGAGRDAQVQAVYNAVLAIDDIHDAIETEIQYEVWGNS